MSTPRCQSTAAAHRASATRAAVADVARYALDSENARRLWVVWRQMLDV
jgi:hypothetical protein